MKRLKMVLQKATAWQIRIVALAFIVISVGSGSHVLINAFAASAETNAISNYTTTHTTITIPTQVAYPQHPALHISSKGYHPIGSSNR